MTALDVVVVVVVDADSACRNSRNELYEILVGFSLARLLVGQANELVPDRA